MKAVPDFLTFEGNKEMAPDLENGILWLLLKKQPCSIGMHCVLNANSREKGKSLLFQPGSTWNLIYT